MDKPAFLKSSQNSGMNDRGAGQEQDPNFTQGQAPGGLSIGDDLPSVAVPGGNPATTGGYSPQADQDSLPRPGSTDGCGTAPTGIRR